VDAMGGDHGPIVTVPAVLNSLKSHPQLNVILFGDEALLLAELAKHHATPSERLRIEHAPESVLMDELPKQALRGKKKSSMRLAINALKEGQVDACVSAGNTGALMATARFVLKTIPGIDRPAILSAFPTMNGMARVLDLGANVDCTTEQLFQFGVMGSVLATAMDGIDKPRVGLLNIGEEEIKGNKQVKDAAVKLNRNPYINYIGYVEGSDLYTGKADVIVCDGFVGNIALKASEGMAKMIGFFIRKAFSETWYAKLGAFFSYRALKKIGMRIDPRRYNGASLLGLKGIVVKSHGSADVYAYMTAIEQALKEIKLNIPQRIAERVALIMSEEAKYE
jgi:glycerol-3-phosphate acyltransferase PlsX